MGWFLVCNSCGHMESVSIRKISQCPDCGSKNIKVMSIKERVNRAESKEFNLTSKAKENLGKGVGIFIAGIIFMILGGMGISNISPYKKCGLFSSNWPLCENQLKDPFELFSDSVGPWGLTIIGGLITFGVGIIGVKKVVDHLRSRSQKPQQIPAGIKEVRYPGEGEQAEDERAKKKGGMVGR